MLLHPMVLAIRRRRAAQGEPRTQALALGPARSLPQPRSQSHPHAQTLGPSHQQLQARTQRPAHLQLQARTQGPARPQPQTQAQGLGPACTQPLAQALGPAYPQATAQALALGPARPQPRARARARQQAQARVYQPHQTFEGLSDRVCIQRYRLTADAMYHLCDLLRGSLGASQNTNFALSVPDKVSTALAILASGSFQRFAAQTTGVGQSTASRVLGQFLEALIPHTPDYITFPTDPSTQGQTMRDFLEIANIPQVLGAVDGTYVNIKKPAQDSHTFVNRHRTYAMNMMVVSSARLEFTDVLARFPGSSHDSSVWSQSALLRRFRRGEFTPGWLLGDHSYPLQPWLLTPLAHPEGDAELQYNHAHKRTRSVVERAVSLLKMRWQCLHASGGTLQYSPEKVNRIFVACCVLHNIAIRRGIPLPEGLDVDEENETDLEEAGEDSSRELGTAGYTSLEDLEETDEETEGTAPLRQVRQACRRRALRHRVEKQRGRTVRARLIQEMFG